LSGSASGTAPGHSGIWVCPAEGCHESEWAFPLATVIKTQSVKTVFNWTDEERARAIDLADLGLKEPDKYRIVEVFGEPNRRASSVRTLNFAQKAHSVRMIKLIDESVPLAEPQVEIRSAASAKAGESLVFDAAASSSAAPVLTYHWEFGDGSSTDGMEVTHAFTHAGDYAVQVTATGLGATTSHKAFTVSVSGEVATQFEQGRKLRP
jgi:hypothetical protein